LPGVLYDAHAYPVHRGTSKDLDAGARQAVASLTRYVVLLIGFLVILQTAGIDLTTLNVLAGALGIGLGFGLRAWSDTQVHHRGRLVSALNVAIYERFREHDIEIPFPQRDLHIRSGAVEPGSGS
jgi:small-conductance mechanosensitive channel